MRKQLAWLGAATLMVLMSVSVAHAQATSTTLKPYVVLVLDTSNSMFLQTGSGPTTCGKSDTRINHAVCAINNIVNSYGDMVFAFARFKATDTGTESNNCASGCTEVGANCGDCDPTTTNTGKACTGSGQGTCSSASDTCVGGFCTGPNACTTADSEFQLLTALVDGGNSSTALFTDGTCNECGVTTGGTNNPEIWGVGNPSYTPIAGTLAGDKRYWQGLQATDSSILWPSTSPGFDPINRDPSSAVFLPPTGQATCDPTPGCTGTPTPCCTSQCRPYVTILLTDGDEDCTNVSNTLASTAALLSTTPHADTVQVSAPPTGATRTGGIVTLITKSGQQFTGSVGDSIVVALTVDPIGASGTFQIKSIVQNGSTNTTITYAQSGADATGSGNGTIMHVASQNKYRIETKPIGFGTTVPYQPIEDIAHSGGAADLPSHNEGYYASDEAGIELAVSQIIEGSVRKELCNGLDDDCDLAIDEDFPDKGNACNDGLPGLCQVNGTLQCRADGTGLQCDAGRAACASTPDGNACTVQNAAGTTVNGLCTNGACIPSPQSSCPSGQTCNADNTETCGNGIDDDCDGKVDEGCATCVPTGEICDGLDNDCDGKIDEGVTRACGTGSCLGTETCDYFGSPTHFVGCTAQTPTAEICDGLDNNCDGVADGFDQACSNLGHCTTNPAIICSDNTPCGAGTCTAVAGGPASNNPGDASNSPIPQNICHPGEKNCPVAPPGNGTFGACVGEVVPEASDPCDGLDNDCDNKIDEDFVPADCSTNCGIGQTQCVGGVITCNSQAATDDSTCNGVDDDCDGKIDEDWVCDPSPSCDSNTNPNCCVCGTGTTCEVNKCINGVVTCTQTQQISPEQCNCADDDCDGKVDEGNLCPGGSTCTNCQCAFPCNGGEFPCPLGKKCQADPNGAGNFCVNDPCYGVNCPAVNGAAQTCVDNGNNTSKCVDACANVTCPSPLACFPQTGQCEPNDCTTYPDRCASNQNCIAGTCVTNLCLGVTCPTDQYCVTGQCYSSCAGVDCPSGQRCRLGTCETDPCGAPCPTGQQCDDSTGVCIDDPCKFRECPQGQYCNPNDGQCETDPCIGTKCPSAEQICRGGTCYDPNELGPDGGTATHVTVGGGGCDAGGGSSGAGLVLALGIMLGARRKRARRTAGGVS